MRFLRVTLMPFAILVLTLAGCKQEDEITKETIENKDREPIRIRVAIVENGDIVWFFRLSGPVELVKANEAPFEGFVKSVKFDGDKAPTWPEPKGWKKDPPMPPGSDRFAGYRIDAKPKELEVTVTRLPTKGYDLIKNMHRWQKQVNVPLTERRADLQPPMVTVDKIGGQEVTWIDLRGLGVHTVSKVPEPMAANQKKFLPGIGVKRPGGGVRAGPFTFSVPAGWVKKPAGQVFLDVYEITEGKSTANLTLSILGGSPGSNIDRWRKQVELLELGADEAVKKAEFQIVAGMKAFVVDLANPKGPPDKNRILGVVIPMGQQNFFIKCTGPLALLEQKKGEFDAFVKSFKKN